MEGSKNINTADGMWSSQKESIYRSIDDFNYNKAVANIYELVNNIQNPYSINEVYASKPLKNETSSLSANIMPTNNN